MPYFQLEKISFGPISIYSWGLFLVSGLLFSFFYSLKIFKKENIDSNIIIGFFPWLIIGLILGARLGYILEYRDYYFQRPAEILKVWQGGLTFFGGLIGVLIAAFIFARFKKMSRNLFFKIADIISLTAPLGMAIARIGCFLINDHQGAKTNLPWGIVWPDGLVRHPVALYLILGDILLYFILRFLEPKLSKPGQLFFIFLFIYCILRFFLDFTRSSSFYLSTVQWLSLALVLGIITKRARYKLWEN